MSTFKFNENETKQMVAEGWGFFAIDADESHDLFTSTYQAPQLSVLSFGAGQDSTALSNRNAFGER